MIFQQVWNCRLLNPILNRGRHKSVCHFRANCARVTKIHDFVPFYIRLVLEKLFFKFSNFFWKYWRLLKISKGGTLLCKNQNFPKNTFFWKTLFFLPEYELYMISAFFWGTYLICSTKFQIFVIFSMKFSILTFPVSMAIATKLHYLEDYFWCLWKGKDLNFHMKANFWSFEAIPQRYHVKTRSGP